MKLIDDLGIKPYAWITEESEWRLIYGGNNSRGTVPLHKNKSHVSKIPLFTEKELRQAFIEGIKHGQ